MSSSKLNEYYKLQEFVNSYKFVYSKQDLRQYAFNDCFVQLIDVWGEVNRLSNYDDNPVFQKQLFEIITKLCESILIADFVSNEMKETLKINLYLLKDYYFLGNNFRQTQKSAIAWFKQWGTSYNMTLLKL
ncbi:MAG: hypothetical protein MJ189_03105 [Coriobacteriales bacterium]|nr:hypothetical protein [Coriobacteriales bacterium]